MKDSRKIIGLTDLLLLFVRINDKFISSVREFVVEARHFSIKYHCFCKKCNRTVKVIEYYFKSSKNLLLLISMKDKYVLVTTCRRHCVFTNAKK